MQELKVSLFAAAAIPYLLLSGAEQSGLITHLKRNASAERLVYARCLTEREGEIFRQLRNVMPGSVTTKRTDEPGSELVLRWRDRLLTDVERAGDIEVETAGIWQKPLSLYTTYKWKETLTFDRAGATDVETEGAELARMKYIVRVPGQIVRTRPPATTTDNKAQWTVRVEQEPQTFVVEGRSLRWPYLLLWIFVGIFVIVKGWALVRVIAKKIPRRPKKI